MLMIHLILLISEFATVLSEQSDTSEGPANITWIASLTNMNFNHLCSAIIIRPTYLATACHCLVRNSSEFPVVPLDLENLVEARWVTAGRYSQISIRKVVKIWVHKKCQLGKNLRYDVGLTKVDIPFPINTQISLAPTFINKEELGENSNCSVAIWRRYKHQYTQIKMGISRLGNCSIIMNNFNDSSLFCAAKVSGYMRLDRGDSGGAFYCTHNNATYIVGILSALIRPLSSYIFVNTEPFMKLLTEVVIPTSGAVSVHLSLASQLTFVAIVFLSIKYCT